MTKTCKDCGDVKPLESFHRDSHLPDGRRHVCKDCARARSAAYRLAARERVQAAGREYKRRPEVMERNRAQLRSRHESDRQAAFAHYGQACASCSSTEDLQIDHVDDSGQQHRQSDAEAHAMYRWLRKHGYPQGLQTLCRRCNLDKARSRRAS